MDGTRVSNTISGDRPERRRPITSLAQFRMSRHELVRTIVSTVHVFITAAQMSNDYSMESSSNHHLLHHEQILDATANRLRSVMSISTSSGDLFPFPDPPLLRCVTCAALRGRGRPPYLAPEKSCSEDTIVGPRHKAL